jgi:DNA-binding NarL/FixJ family response regulator
MLQHDVFLIVTCNEAFELWARGLIQRYGLVRSTSSPQETAAILPTREHWAGVLIDLDQLEADAVSLVKQIRASNALVPLLAVGSLADPDTVNALQTARAEFVMRPIGELNLVSFTRRALVSGRLPDSRLSAYVDELARVHRLTPREVQLVAYALGNESRDDAVRRLGVSENTIKSQVRMLLRKCGKNSMDGLAKMILRDALFFENDASLESAAE